MAKAKSNKGSGVNSTAIEQVSTASLIPYARNARTHSETQVSQIAGSIQEFGFCNPVLIDATNGIIAGHGRVMAAQLLKLETVPCLRLSHLTDAQKRAYVLADNRIALSSGWDEEMLANELSDLHADEFDMALLGFDADELAGLLKLNGDELPAEPSGEIVEDEVPEVPVDPITKPGDLWIIGEHRLLCGDSTKAEDAGRLMNGLRAAATITSPPYNVSAKSSLPNKEKYEDGGDSRSEGDYLSFLKRFTNHAVEVSEYVFVNVQSVSGNKTALINYLHWFSSVYADTIIWDKMGAEPAMASNVMNSRFEYVHCFSKKANRAIGTKTFRGTVENMIFLNSRTDKQFSSVHKATFPVAFPAWIVDRFTELGETIYEPFCGTGTTLIAAEQLNRKCYGMEISPAYCDVIVKRWENLTGKKAVLEAA